jgi:hypothetical protein
MVVNEMNPNTCILIKVYNLWLSMPPNTCILISSCSLGEDETNEYVHF